MSTYRTYKLSDSLQDFSQELLKVTTATSKKECIDLILNISNVLYAYKYSCVTYYKQSLTNNISAIFDTCNNTLNDALSLDQINEEQYEDYILMLEDAKERLNENLLPNKSFFFSYKDGEYYSIMVDEDGKLVEEYKHDQKVEEKKTYQSITDWMNQYAIDLTEIEFAICLDVLDYDFDESISEPSALPYALPSALPVIPVA